MEGYQELYILTQDFERCKALVRAKVFTHCLEGARYELHFDPNPQADYGHLKAVIAYWGPELEQEEQWDVIEHPGYGVAGRTGTYIIARGIVSGEAPMLSEEDGHYTEARRAAVHRVLAAEAAFFYEKD